jgi:hypothetical protein
MVFFTSHITDQSASQAESRQPLFEKVRMTTFEEITWLLLWALAGDGDLAMVE